MSAKKVIVIGAGLGGLSAAISLRQSGYEVEMFEKNGKVGGKLNVLTGRGYTFDLGPSILTLPHLFERLFERSGRKMADYIPIRTLRPHWRNFFEDGVTLDLYPEPDKMAAEARKVGEPPENIQRFLQYSADLYDLTNDGYFEQGLDNWREFARHYDSGSSSSLICSARCIREWRHTSKPATSATSSTFSSNTSAHRRTGRRHS